MLEGHKTGAKAFGGPLRCSRFFAVPLFMIPLLLGTGMTTILASSRMRRGGWTSHGRKARHAREGVIPPRAVIVTSSDRLAELTVVRNVDTKRALLFHYIGDGRGQNLRIRGVI